MSTVTSVTTTSPISNTERLRRQQAVDGAIAQLSYNTFVGADGKSVNLLSKYELTDLMAARGPIADQIRSLLNVEPPLSSFQVQAQATTLINQFRSQYPVAPRAAPVVTTPTAPTSTMSTRDRLLRQQAVDGAVAQLAYNVFPDGSGKQLYPLRNGYTLAQLNEKRAPFTDQIRALLAKEPPLTPDQIRTEAAKITSNFRALFGATPAAAAATAETDRAAARAAADAAIAKLRGATSVVYDGQTLVFSEWLSESDMAGERSAIEAKINALANKTPPATPAEITAQADGMINEYKELCGAMCMAIQGMVTMMLVNNFFRMQATMANMAEAY